GFEVAAFVSTDRAALFASTPHAPAAGATTLTVSGLPDGVVHFVGLGLRPLGGGAFVQTGPTVTATPGSPLYVDAASTAGSPDGLTPATAFHDVLTAVLTAFARLNVDPATNVDVWVKGGSYTISTTLPITAGVHVYGGFGAGFGLASRDVAGTPTVWNVDAGRSGFQCGDQLNTRSNVIVDGVRIAGNGIGKVGVDTDSGSPCSLELRSVIVTDMADRGI